MTEVGVAVMVRAVPPNVTVGRLVPVHDVTLVVAHSAVPGLYCFTCRLLYRARPALSCRGPVFRKAENELKARRHRSAGVRPL